MERDVVKLFQKLFEEVYGEIPEDVKPLLKVKEGFRPPTIEEVEQYLREQNVLNPKECATQFHSFYEAKGWMIGKNKMKKWQSAIKTWKFPKRGLIL